MRQRIKEVLEDILKDYGESVDFKVTRPEDREFGDYTTNLPFLLAKSLRRNPVEIGEEIAKKISVDGLEVTSVRGFINFRISKGVLQNNLLKAIEEGYGKGEGKGIKINVEFVSANPTGPLHLASARAAAFGDTLVRLLRYKGYTAESEYYVNDAGKQIDNLALSVDARIKEIKGEKYSIPEDGYHGEYIRDIAMSAVELGIKGFDELKGFSVDYILDMQKKTLKRFRVEFDRFVSEKWIRESGRIQRVIDGLKKAGKTFERENALWYRGERDRVLVKSDGEFTYIVPDIAYHAYKFERGFDLVIDLLGPDHIAHVPDLKRALTDLGYPGEKVELIIIQWVHLLKEGKLLKMSKRAGEFVTMDELIDEVGVDPVRFFMLMIKASSPLEFDIELAKKQTTENPVYYVQYSHARICSLLDHAENEGYRDLTPEGFENLNLEEEISILREIYHFPEFLEDVAESRDLHLIPRFLLELSSLYHNFYQKYRIVGGEKEKVVPRLFLSMAVKNLVKTGLDLMGVSAPERM